MNTTPEYPGDDSMKVPTWVLPLPVILAALADLYWNHGKFLILVVLVFSIPVTVFVGMVAIGMFIEFLSRIFGREI